MRLTAIDVIIVLVLLNIPLVPVLYLPQAHCLSWILLLLCPLFVLVPGSAIYKKLKFTPIGLPQCPHCSQQDKLHRLDYVMGRVSWFCGGCEGLFHCWYSDPPVEYKPGVFPELKVVFPFLIGRYISTWPGQAKPAVEPVFPEEIFRVLFVGQSRPLQASLLEQPELLGDCKGQFDNVISKNFPSLKRTQSGWSDELGLVVFQTGRAALLGTLKRSTDPQTNIRNQMHLAHLREWFEDTKPSFRWYTKTD